MDFFQIILSSAVVAAIISWFRGERDNQLTHITHERSVWRQQIKENLEKFQSSSLEEIDQCLIGIKSNLNGYGYHNTNQYPEDIDLDIFRDEHIWKAINELESKKTKETCSTKSIEKQKNRIIYFIVALLKFDWERSKREVNSDRLFIISNIFVVIYTIAVSYNWFANFEVTENTMGLPKKLYIVVHIMAFYLIPWIVSYANSRKFIRKRKWYKRNSSILVIWVICFVCQFIMLIYLYVHYRAEIILTFVFWLYLLAILIQIYHVLTTHEMYDNYESAVMEIMDFDTIIIYGNAKDIQLGGAIGYLIRTGINWRVVRNINYFMKKKDKEFTNFLDKQVGIKILNRKGKRKYKSFKDRQNLSDFIRENPSMCMPFVRYKTGNTNKPYKYILLKRSQLKKLKFITC